MKHFRNAINQVRPSVVECFEELSTQFQRLVLSRDKWEPNWGSYEIKLVSYLANASYSLCWHSHPRVFGWKSIIYTLWIPDNLWEGLLPEFLFVLLLFFGRIHVHHVLSYGSKLDLCSPSGKWEYWLIKGDAFRCLILVLHSIECKVWFDFDFPFAN